MNKKDTNEAIEITRYTDYVPFIKDLIKRKKDLSGFSFRVFCRKSGFKSPTYLKWVVDGVRPISAKSIHKFVSGLSLDKRESQYFTLMVNYKEAHDSETKRFYYEQMLEWQHRRIGKVTKDAFEYLSHWYYIAIRELIGSSDFREDMRWIRDRLEGNLTLWDIKNGIATLERLHLIKRDDKGILRLTERDLRTEHEVQSLAAYSYHEEMLELAGNALVKRPPEERDFQSLVAMIDDDTLKTLKNKIEEFQGVIIAFLHNEEKRRTINKGSKKEELYALNIQMVPLTVRRKGEL